MKLRLGVLSSSHGSTPPEIIPSEDVMRAFRQNVKLDQWYDGNLRFTAYLFRHDERRFVLYNLFCFNDRDYSFMLSSYPDLIDIQSKFSDLRIASPTPADIGPGEPFM